MSDRQRTLFEMGTPDQKPTTFEPPRQRHSETSTAAAEAIKPRINELQARVLEYLKSCGGATDEQGADALGMGSSTYRPRRIELVDMGRVKAEGKAKGRSHRWMTVWKAV